MKRIITDFYYTDNDNDNENENETLGEEMKNVSNEAICDSSNNTNQCCRYNKNIGEYECGDYDKETCDDIDDMGYIWCGHDENNENTTVKNNNLNQNLRSTTDFQNQMFQNFF